MTHTPPLQNAVKKVQDNQLDFWISAAAAHRLSLPQDERRHPWLSLMLNAFAIIEASTAQTVAASPVAAACRAGCIPCCQQSVIPVTPLEAEALRFWVKNKLTPSLRNLVLAALCRASETVAIDCPFLVNKSCAVYPVRPIACRRFMVRGTPCGPTEDCMLTRPHDVLRPSREALHAALALTAPFYERIGLLPQGQTPDFTFFTRICLNLKQLPWEQEDAAP